MTALTSTGISAAPPDAFDRELEAERALWLRRRFVWFCAVMFLIDGLFCLGSLGTVVSGGADAPVEIIYLIFFAPLVALYLAAAAYAWRTATPRLRTFVLLSAVLTATDGVLTLIYFHVSRDHDLAAGEAGANLSWASAVILSVLLIQLIPCLLIPWTMRESLRSAAAMVGFLLLSVGWDVGRGQLHPESGAAVILLSTLAVAPGAVACWVRFSRFQETFLWRFESGQYRRLQNELTSAQRLHEACLPAPLAEGPVRLNYVYEPMRQIGGDLLFVHPPAGTPAAVGGRISAVILDVTGHGIAAALTVNRLAGELERLFAEDPGISPGAVLSGLNRYVALTLSRHQMFATALCLRADASAGVVEWASGGHPPAYLRRTSGTVEPLGATAPMLGALEPPEFHASPARLPFAPGDVVLAYTDGASEAVDPDREPLGTAGVLRLLTLTSTDGLAPADWPAAILRQVCAHRGQGALPEDDTLIVALTRA